MYSQADLEDAVAAGALAPDQAARLRDYVATRNGAPTGDEEYARFVLGFNDLFVAYACLFALLALGFIGAQIPGGQTPFGIPAMPFVMGGLLVAGGAWGLSELFLRRGRFALPAILLPFALGFGTVVAWLGLTFMILGRGQPNEIVVGLIMAIGTAGAAALTWLHWRRFRMPFAAMLWVALAVLAILILIASLVARSGAAGSINSILLLIAGLGTFAYAMRWDASDPLRFNVRSEVGMWVHWLAAAFITYGIMGLFGISNGIASTGGAIAMIFIYLLFAAVALIVNRRQLLILGLTPLLAALFTLMGGGRRSSRYDEDDFDLEVDRYGGSDFDRFGADPGMGGMGGYRPGSGMGRSNMEMLLSSTITLVVLSVILLLLALFWRPLRRALLAIVPAGLRHRLPPVDRQPPAQGPAV